MKTEDEINKMTSDMKDILVEASGENILSVQGFIKALQWVMRDEKDDGFRDDKS